MLNTIFNLCRDFRNVPAKGLPCPMCKPGSDNLTTKSEYEAHVESTHRKKNKKVESAERMGTEKYFCHHKDCRAKAGAPRSSYITHTYVHEKGHFCVDCQKIVQFKSRDWSNHAEHHVCLFWEFDEISLSEFEIWYVIISNF